MVVKDSIIRVTDKAQNTDIQFLFGSHMKCVITLVITLVVSCRWRDGILIHYDSWMLRSVSGAESPNMCSYEVVMAGVHMTEDVLTSDHGGCMWFHT